MGSAVILTPADLASLTARTRPAAQRRVLDALGVAYAVRPDGSLIVARDPVERMLGVKSEQTTQVGSTSPSVRLPPQRRVLPRNARQVETHRP